MRQQLRVSCPMASGRVRALWIGAGQAGVDSTVNMTGRIAEKRTPTGKKTLPGRRSANPVAEAYLPANVSAYTHEKSWNPGSQ